MVVLGVVVVAVVVVVVVVESGASLVASSIGSDGVGSAGACVVVVDVDVVVNFVVDVVVGIAQMFAMQDWPAAQHTLLQHLWPVAQHLFPQQVAPPAQQILPQQACP